LLLQIHINTCLKKYFQLE